MEEVSVGDAVLAGGEVATLLILEATLRLLPGVLGNEASLAEESFEEGFLEQPQYTRPREWEGRTIPDILLSGDHAKVAAWRRAERQRVTAARRPDLLRSAPAGGARKDAGDAPILPLPHPLPAAGESNSD
jgi:tRNA (guanine37-N1)-methyltransferase